VDEVLRWAGPAGISTLRHTTGPVPVGDVTIGAHEFVLVALESANRDPRHYPVPERFDLRRNAGHGVAFGHGVHHCLGAALARLEGQVAIGHLITRFPDLAFASDPGSLRWRPNIMMRGLDRLPITLIPERSNDGSSV
jgi:cytochrome P450